MFTYNIECILNNKSQLRTTSRVSTYVDEKKKTKHIHVIKHRIVSQHFSYT